MRTTKTNDYKKNYWEDFTDDAAASYMETYGEGPGFELRHKIGSLIKPKERVLDVGCGPGWNYDHFRAFGPEVRYKGLDLSNQFIKMAQRRWRQLNDNAPIPSSSPFDVGDVRDFKDVIGDWDVVILQDVLEHTNGYEKPVEDALRVAKRLVIITFWHLEDTDDPHINDDGSDTWGTWYDKRQWEAYLNTLSYQWSHERLVIGKNRDVYVIHKESDGTLPAPTGSDNSRGNTDEAN